VITNVRFPTIIICLPAGDHHITGHHTLIIELQNKAAFIYFGKQDAQCDFR